MDLKSFVSGTLSEIIGALDDVSEATNKNISLYSTGKNNQRHVEFDVAVVAESKTKNKAQLGAGIKVLEFLDIGTRDEKAKETKDSAVTRIKFGVRVK